MTRLFLAAAAITLCGASLAFAADEYNTVPAGDLQFAQCIAYANGKYTGGEAASPIAGQSKAQAFCTCMWNETPDDFKGSLGKFADTAAGAKTNATCEKYSNWQ